MSTIKHLLNLRKQGWQCDYLANSKQSLLPLASFYTFHPSSEQLMYASMPIDDYLGLVGKEMKAMPRELVSSAILSGCLAELTHVQADLSLRHAVPAVAGLYMATTNAGASYHHNHLGKPFHFICIMYPCDKKGKQFRVRPFLILHEKSVLSVGEIKTLCEGVMRADKKRHPEYFKYLRHNTSSASA